MIWLPRTTDNSTYFAQSLEIRGIEGRLYFSFYEQLKFRAQLSMKKNLLPRGLTEHSQVANRTSVKISCTGPLTLVHSMLTRRKQMR